MNLNKLLSVFSVDNIAENQQESMNDVSVISASSNVSHAANDHYAISVVTPVIQETVGQSEPLNGVNANHENLVAHPQTEDGPLSRYIDLVKCQQCENLSLTGFCTVKPQYKPMPDAMRDCSSFDAAKRERITIQGEPYTQEELSNLMGRYEKRLFHHLVKCDLCVVSNHRYCVDGFAIGNAYEAVLLCFDSADAIRDKLITKVVRTRLSGYSVFEVYRRPDAPTTPAKTHKYGITQTDNNFLAHINDCPSCKHRGRLYCKEARRLQGLIPD